LRGGRSRGRREPEDPERSAEGERRQGPARPEGLLHVEHGAAGRKIPLRNLRERRARGEARARVFRRPGAHVLGRVHRSGSEGGPGDFRPRRFQFTGAVEKISFSFRVFSEEKKEPQVRTASKPGTFRGPYGVV